MERQGSLFSPRFRRWALAGAALGIGLTPAAANAACSSTPVSKPFKRFADTANYSLAPGGAFETGTSGWSLTNAAVTAGNETYFANDQADSHSLAIAPNGVAVSAPICVGIDHPQFRFFARRTSGLWAVMLVKLRWTDTGGTQRETTVGALNGLSLAWAPTPPMQLATALPLRDAQSLSVRVVFDPEDYGGAWAIDDLFVDPYRKS
ncbi:MAG: hypothetical protein QOF76_4937 [Solirubrobacteraceae bacterium]|jgi:hypothetical protein|nr:hypothetical protein [Solirubrobacteraceae bacterium]